jgi:hypothetical protein
MVWRKRGMRELNQTMLWGFKVAAGENALGSWDRMKN